MIPESINDLSVIATNNVPQGGDNVGGTLDDILRAHATIMKRDLALKKAETAVGTSFTPTANVLSENVQAALAELGNKVDAINWSSISGKPSLVETSRSISTSTGLVGGGNLSANRTLAIESTYSPNTSRSLTSENLNDLKTPGFYHQTTNANALTSRNYPTAQAGTLVVTHAAGVVQEYTCYNSGNKYYRGFYISSWGGWRRVYHSGNITASTAAPSGGDDGDIWLRYE